MHTRPGGTTLSDDSPYREVPGAYSHPKSLPKAPTNHQLMAAMTLIAQIKTSVRYAHRPLSSIPKSHTWHAYDLARICRVEYGIA